METGLIIGYGVLVFGFLIGYLLMHELGKMHKDLIEIAGRLADMTDSVASIIKENRKNTETLEEITKDVLEVLKDETRYDQ